MRLLTVSRLSILLLVCISLGATSRDARAALREDVNRDGAVNVMDMLRVVLTVRQGGYQAACDYNGDGAVSIVDVSSLGRALFAGTETQAEDILESPQLSSVDAATFNMGNDEGEDNEKPEHEVTVSAFKISRHEITNYQYAAYLNEALELGTVSVSGDTSAVADSGDYAGKELLYFAGKRAKQNECWTIYSGGRFHAVAGKENWPVVFVTWYGAAAYAEHYSLRLPTEAEWECAASGAGTRAYATSDGLLDSTALNFSAIVGHPTDVGSYLPNVNALFDMSGNVWELCSDWYGEYPDSTEVDPTGPAEGEVHVRRGGGWNSCDVSTTTTAREAQDYADHRGPGIGFRVASDIE